MDGDPPIQVSEATATNIGRTAAVVVNGERLETPAGNPVEVEPALAEAMAEELRVDRVVDVSRPSLYGFYSAERDFIAPDPTRTIDALVELLGHDYLVHPEDRLGRRQAQIAAWEPQINLWQRVAGRDPPYAPPGSEPDLNRDDYAAFRVMLSGFTPSQLSVAIHGANLLKSATLGVLLATREIDARSALEAAAVTPRLYAGDSQEDLERQEGLEEEWRSAIERLLRYARLTSRTSAE